MSSRGTKNPLPDSPKPPSDEEALALYHRLLAADPTAPNDLAVMLLPLLIHWLQKHNPKISPELVIQAGEDALLNLIRRPSTYDPKKNLPLEKYLRMSAQGDLRNALVKAKREQTQQISLNLVELSDQSGKYLGKEDDPSLPLQMAEMAKELSHTIPAEVRDGLTGPELCVLELMLQGEYRTMRFAEAYGILHLDQKEQQRQIKRLKDKLQKRLARKGTKHDGTS